ncbi:MAG: ribonuclease D [Rhodospirillales bacterium]|nr:ribonuclease D [Rhodospirillales bacterium]
MQLITTTDALAAFCERLATAEFVTVDTEFMRERTYWPQLCLAQVGGPDEAAAIDSLAPGIDLAPFFALLDNPTVLKVFHAARQDLEIFLKLTGRLPTPIFDTQVAAMVCGFGDQVAYDTLAAKLAKARIDKSSRFTDWARRPLSDKQLHYALSDVTYLRVVYERLRDKLAKTGRDRWIDEEMAILREPGTFRVEPEDAWRRLKPRNPSPRMMVLIRELADWREREAQRVDVPRQRILRDEQLMEIASHTPTSVEQLATTRGIGRGFVEGKQGRAVLDAVERALAVPEADLPPRERPAENLRAPGAVVDLLKVLLRLRCDADGVATRLVASSDDIDRLAAGKRDVPCLSGWRHEIFGRDALRLMGGELAVGLDGDRIRLIEAARRTAAEVETG